VKTSSPVHYSADETVPSCGAKSKAVSHYLSEISCLKCVLILRNMGIDMVKARKGVKRGRIRGG
jgi:hypothetical protein